MRAIVKPLPIAMLILFVIAVTVSVRYGTVREHASYLNERSDKIYSSVFTFLVAFWGACLTVWGLLKSRATRYIERLSDNVVFKAFMRQYERRLIYAFLAVIATFVMYVADFKIGQEANRDFYVIAVWAYAIFSVSCALGDVLLTARELLD